MYFSQNSQPVLANPSLNSFEAGYAARTSSSAPMAAPQETRLGSTPRDIASLFPDVAPINYHHTSNPAYVSGPATLTGYSPKSTPLDSQTLRVINDALLQ